MERYRGASDEPYGGAEHALGTIGGVEARLRQVVEQAGSDAIRFRSLFETYIRDVVAEDELFVTRKWWGVLRKRLESR